MKINHIPRTVSRDDWRTIWRHFRKYIYKNDFMTADPLIEKTRCVDRIRQFATWHTDENGIRQLVVCVNERGMDCDCAIGTSWTIVPAIYYAVDRALNDIYENAEGPTSTWISRPANHVESEFRDLALEAHENGHPHVVYY